MFHPAQQHSAYLWETCVLMKTVIELLYTLHRGWYLVDCTWCINDLFCSAMQINSSRFPIAMGDGFPGQEFNGWPCPPPLLSHAIEKITTQIWIKTGGDLHQHLKLKRRKTAVEKCIMEKTKYKSWAQCFFSVFSSLTDVNSLFLHDSIDHASSWIRVCKSPLVFCVHRRNSKL